MGYAVTEWASECCRTNLLTFSGHPLTMPENKVTTATRGPTATALFSHYTHVTLMTTCCCLTRAMQTYTNARTQNQSLFPTPITDLFLLKEKYKPGRSAKINTIFIYLIFSLILTGISLPAALIHIHISQSSQAAFMHSCIVTQIWFTGTVSSPHMPQ